MNSRSRTLRGRHAARLACALLIGAVAPAYAHAQRSPDAVSVARTMKESGASASRVAAELKRQHTRDAVATTDALRTVGYNAVETATALNEEYRLTGTDAFYAMRNVGYPVRSVIDALNRTGMRVQLECRDRDGMAVPCGAFGGNSEQPAMSQLTWTPYDHGQADSTLTITGSGIPQVDVRIGSTVLDVLERTATRVRAKLPSTGMTGALTLRRVSDGVVGQLTAMFTVEPPIPPTTREQYTVNGTAAWEEAHKHGFEFYPVPQAFLVVTQPRDGVDTRLRDDAPQGQGVVFARVTMGELFAYGGVPSGTYTFRLFANRDLANGWAIIDVIPASPAKFGVRPSANSSTPAFELTLSAGLLEQVQTGIGTLVLEGPAGGNWRDAFRN